MPAAGALSCRITLDSFIALELCCALAWPIDEYRTAAGETPVRTFIGGLPPDAKAEAATRRMRENG